MKMPDVEVTVVGPQSQLAAMGQQALDAGRARHRAFAEALAEGLSQSDFSVVAETDAGAAPLPAGARVLRLEVEDLLTSVDPRTGAATGCMIFGSLTVGLGYLACLGVRNRIDQTANVNLALYDVSGMTSTRIERDGELVRILDTSSLRPVLRRSYSAEVESGHHVMRAPRGDDVLEFARAQGRRLGQLVYAAIAADLERSLRSIPPASTPTPTPTPTPVPEAPAPSGGDQAQTPFDEPAPTTQPSAGDPTG